MLQAIAADVFQIVLPTPFPVGPVNCYVTTTSPITLIDTGTHWPASQQELIRQLDGLGLSLSSIQQIIVTHAHADHYGLAAEIVRQSGAQVWAHRLNHTFMAPTEQCRQQRQQFYRSLLIESGVPVGSIDDFMRSRSGARQYAEPVGIDRELEEGDVVWLADQPWDVLHTPGHAGGLICLFQPTERMLLSNDHLLRNISSNPVIEPDPEGGPRPHRLVEYLFHLQRVADLNPTIAWTGHGKEVLDVVATVRRRMRLHERRADHIVDLLSVGQLNAYELTDKIFGARHGFDSFLALSETIGHLDWLEEQGRIRAACRDRVYYWAAIP